MKKIAVLLCASTIALAGCASFSKHQVAKVDKLPDVSQFQNKPKVYVDFRFFNGQPDTIGLPENTQARNQLQPQMEKLLNDSQMFSFVSFDPAAKPQSDYTLNLHVYNHGDIGGAAVLGFLCGFTFGVIPAVATDNYTLVSDVSGADGVGNKLQNTDAITTWMGLWFIPVMGNTPMKAVNETLSNQVRDALKRMVDSGNIKYSWLFDPQLNHG